MFPLFIMFKQAIIIGAGPAGLMQAYELQKLGIDTLIIEASDKAGGEFMKNPNSPIYNIPNIPCITNKQFIDRLLSKLTTPIHYNEHVISINEGVVVTNKQVYNCNVTFAPEGYDATFKIGKKRLELILAESSLFAQQALTYL